jgi:acyl-CoA reductase-like NAD-dependent aldehyde dehydrogenase
MMINSLSSDQEVFCIKEVYEPLKEKFLAATSKIKLGYGLDQATQMGLLVSPDHLANVIKYIEKGVEEG